MMVITVGPGKDYSSMNGALQYLTSISPLSEATDIIVQGDTTEGAISGSWAINLGGYTLRIYSDSPHGGDPTAGHVLNISASNRAALKMQSQGTGLLEVYGLRFRGSGSNGSIQGLDLSSNGPDIKCHDCIIDFSGMTGTSLRPLYISAPSATPDYDFWNIAIACPSTASVPAAIQAYNSYAAAMVLEDISVQGGNYGLNLAGAPMDVRNCVAFGAALGAFFNVGGANGYNNASDDGSSDDVNWSTGVGNVVTPIVPASAFYSLSTSDSEWLKVRPGGVLENAGTTVTITENVLGIRVNDRPHGTDFSIGADEGFGHQRPGQQAKQLQLNTSSFVQNLDVNVKTVQQLAEATDQLRVLAPPELSIPDVTETGTDQDGDARMAINEILSVLRAQGLIDEESSSSSSSP